TYTLHHRNPKLFTPRDFDYSPYFDVIKYPIFDFDELAVYKQLPWNKEGITYSNLDEDIIPENFETDTILQSVKSATKGNQ
ncbi:MAG: hypothetical protein KAU21_19515, partial [Gammaproteobacteria bacterium]|nr:hypothetical protein [Gammaproteobacteria bacterium]